MVQELFYRSDYIRFHKYESINHVNKCIQLWKSTTRKTNTINSDFGTMPWIIVQFTFISYRYLHKYDINETRTTHPTDLLLYPHKFTESMEFLLISSCAADHNCLWNLDNNPPVNNTQNSKVPFQWTLNIDTMNISYLFTLIH